MDSFGKALQWIGGNVQVLRKSDTSLNKACSPLGIRRCDSYKSITDNTDVKRNGNEGNLPNKDVDVDNQCENAPIKGRTIANVLTVQTAHTNDADCSSSDINGEKLSPCIGSEPVSPFEYKTLVLIPPSQGLSGTRVAEIKPSPVSPVQPPVTLGIVRSSTTRLNEISPPCPKENEQAYEEIKNPIDIFNRRRLKAKSASFTGVENFRQKPPRVVQRTNSAALIKIPENSPANYSSPPKPEFHISISETDSEKMGDKANKYVVPENLLAANDNDKSHLSVFSALSTRNDSEDRTSISSYSSMSKSDLRLKSVSRTSISSYSSMRKSDLRLTKSVSIQDDTDSFGSRQSTSCISRSSYSTVGRTPSPCRRPDESEYVFHNDFDIGSETKKSPRKIDAILKAFRLGETNNDSRLSLFSMKSRKRFKRDKMYIQDKVAATNIPSITIETNDKNKNEIVEDVQLMEGSGQNVKASRNRTLKKRISCGELHMRSAQLELFKSNVSKPEGAVSADCDLGRVQFIVYSLNSGQTLRVSNLKATGIHRPTHCSKSTQLFATLCLKPGKYKTITSNKVVFTENPEFQQEFYFEKVSLKTMQDMRLKISIYRKDALLSFPKCIGKTYTPLTDCELHVGKPIWKILRPKTWKVCMSIITCVTLICMCSILQFTAVNFLENEQFSDAKLWESVSYVFSNHRMFIESS